MQSSLLLLQQSPGEMHSFGCKSLVLPSYKKTPNPMDCKRKLLRNGQRFFSAFFRKMAREMGSIDISTSRLQNYDSCFLPEIFRFSKRTSFPFSQPSGKRTIWRFLGAFQVFSAKATGQGVFFASFFRALAKSERILAAMWRLLEAERVGKWVLESGLGKAFDGASWVRFEQFLMFLDRFFR